MAANHKAALIRAFSKAKNEMKTEWVMKFEWMETDNAEKIDWMPL